MFINYLTLIMINLVTGSALLAYYLWRGIDEEDQRSYAAASKADAIFVSVISQLCRFA